MVLSQLKEWNPNSSVVSQFIVRVRGAGAGAGW